MFIDLSVDGHLCSFQELLQMCCHSHVCACITVARCFYSIGKMLRLGTVESNGTTSFQDLFYSLETKNAKMALYFWNVGRKRKKGKGR